MALGLRSTSGFALFCSSLFRCSAIWLDQCFARAALAVGLAGGRLAAGREWWTRNERTRTVAALPLEEFLRDTVPAPVYQRLAFAAAILRAKGWNDHSIAVEFRVTDKTIAKAIRWLHA